MSKKAALYLRVSTQDKQDYTRQHSELLPLAQQHGYKESDIDIYAEKISGYTKDEERPELNKLLVAIETSLEKYSMVYVLEISRLARKGKIIRDIIDRLKESKVPLFIKNLGLKTLEDDGKESIATNLIVAIYSELADEYARTFKANSKSGLRQAAISGKALGSNNHAYGLTKKEKKGKLVIEESEVPAIQEIFNLYKSGMGVHAIANMFNDRSVPTRMNKTHATKTIKYKNGLEKDGAEVKWSDKQIYDILKNPIYCGKRRHKEELFDSPATVIISTDLFEQCQVIMKSKTHRNYLTTYTYLLKNRIFCGCCSRNYFAKYKPVINGDKVYICSSRLIKSGNCGNAGINISLVESALYDQLLRTDAILKYFGDTTGLKTKLQDSLKQMSQRMTFDEGVLATRRAAIERLDDAYYNDGSIAKDVYYARREKVEKELKALTSNLKLIMKEINEKTMALERIDEKKATKEMLINAADNRNHLQSIFRQIIDRVVINKVDKDNILAVVYIALNGVVLKNTLKLMLDISGIRKKPMQFNYKAMFRMENDPVYYNNKLVVDTADIHQEFESLGEIRQIPHNYVLSIEPSL